MFSDVSIPTFDPKVFRTAWSLRRRVSGLEEPTGITYEELQQLCIQCKDCGNFVTQTSHAWHECTDTTIGDTERTAAARSNLDDFFQSPEYRLDAIGASLGGVTKEEFETIFTQCVHCECLLTAEGCKRHPI